MIVAIEGLDGAGKTLQAEMLRSRLAKRGVPARVLRLYGTPRLAAQFERLNAQNLISARESSLMTAAELAGRLDILDNLQRPGGEVTVWDKYLAGSRARDAARGVDKVQLSALYEPLPAADLTIYLALSPEKALIRKRGAGGPRIWESGLDVALGLEVREVERRLAAGIIRPSLVEEQFLAFQRVIEREYQATLGATIVTLDGFGDIDSIADQVFAAVIAGLPSTAEGASA